VIMGLYLVLLDKRGSMCCHRVQVTAGHGDIEEQHDSVNLICTCRMIDPDQINSLPTHVL
jgi:hypothetical protein